MWTGECGLAMLHATRLCLELIPTFSHGKEFQATAHDYMGVACPSRQPSGGTIGRVRRTDRYRLQTRS